MIDAQVQMDVSTGRGAVEIGEDRWERTGAADELRVALLGVVLQAAAARNTAIRAEIFEPGAGERRWLLISPTGEVTPTSAPLAAVPLEPSHEDQQGADDPRPLPAVELPAPPPLRAAPPTSASDSVEPIPQSPESLVEDRFASLDLEVHQRGEVSGAARHLPRCVRILVANNKGESGKTPVAVMIAQAFAAARRTNDVALIDLDPTGNLSSRVGVPPTEGRLPDVAAAIEQRGTARWEDTLSLLAWEPASRVWVINSRGIAKTKAPVASHITPAQFRSVLDALEAEIRVVVIDAGNNDRDAVFLEAAAMADQLVVPVKWDVPTVSVGARGVLSTLWDEGLTDLATGAIAVGSFPPHRRPNKRQEARLRAEFVRLGHSVVDIPVDPHIDARTAISWLSLKPATRAAATKLANLIGDRAAGRMRPQ